MKWTASADIACGDYKQPIFLESNDDSMDSDPEENTSSDGAMIELLCLLPQFDQPDNDHIGQLTVFLKECRDAAEKSIGNHLKAFSKRQKAYKDLDLSIQAVCERGSHLLLDTPPIWDYDTLLNEAVTDEARTLLQHQISKTNKIDSSRIFQKRWLTNIPRLLPHDSEVMQTLPYLITCYTITASENRLDPFDKDKSTAASGWRDIFVELMDQNPSWETNMPDPSSRRENIRSLCNRFLTTARRKNVPHKKENKVRINEKDFYHMFTSFWEHYRRFAAFCLACREEREVNITLSTALFWNAQKEDMENMFGKDFSSSQNWEDIVVSRDISQRLTTEGIASDIIRDEILELFDGQDGADSLNLHEIAYYLNLEDIEDKRSKEHATIIEELGLYKLIEQFGSS